MLRPLYHLSLIVENVELTSSKQRQFTCPGDQVTFTCRVFGSFSLEWRSPLITQRTSFITTNSFPRSVDRGPFNASLIDISINGSAFTNANFTSTLQVTTSRMITRSETTVMCLSTAANETDNFTVGGDYCITCTAYVCVYRDVTWQNVTTVSVYLPLLIVSYNNLELASFPGSSSRTNKKSVLEATESWAGPGNEANLEQ